MLRQDEILRFVNLQSVINGSTLRAMKRKNFIKEIREERGISGPALAEMCNMTQSNLSHIENGRNKLTWDHMQTIARALECHPMDLVEGIPQPRSEDEKRLLRTYRGLEDRQREMFSTMLTSLSSAEKQKQSDIPYDQDESRESQKQKSGKEE